MDICSMSHFLDKARILNEDSDYTAAEVCKSFGIGRRTFFKYLEDMNKAEIEAKELERCNPSKVISEEF